MPDSQRLTQVGRFGFVAQQLERILGLPTKTAFCRHSFKNFELL
jgi:hypothetical protein